MPDAISALELHLERNRVRGDMPPPASTTDPRDAQRAMDAEAREQTTCTF